MRKIRTLLMCLSVLSFSTGFCNDTDFQISQKCNEIQNAVQMLCNAKSWEVYQMAKHDNKSIEFYYLLGQMDGLTQAHEEILKTMNWYGHHETK